MSCYLRSMGHLFFLFSWHQEILFRNMQSMQNQSSSAVYSPHLYQGYQYVSAQTCQYSFLDLLSSNWSNPLNLLMLSSPTISCGSKSHKFIVYCVNYLSQINLTSYINCFLGFVLWVLQLVNLEISLCLPCPALILAG